MPLTKTAISLLRLLREKKHREEQGLFVVEGEKVVKELIAAKFPLVEIYITPALQREVSDPRAVTISDAEMARISHFPTPSGALAVGRIERLTLAPRALECGLTLALDAVQDAGNVGTLLRVADWFGFDRIVLSPECADLFSQKVINASMGSFSRVKAYSTPLPDVLSEAGRKVPVYGCDLEGSPVSSMTRTLNAVVVVGSEGRGLSAATAAAVTQRVTIPRFGGAESLNVAVAAGIVCFTLRGLN